MMRRKFFAWVITAGCMLFLSSLALTPMTFIPASVHQTLLGARSAVRETNIRSASDHNESMCVCRNADHADVTRQKEEKKETSPPNVKYVARTNGLGPWHRNISKKLYMLAKEAFDVIPTSFLPGYKSPCFYEDPAKEEESLRCLAYFYVVGIQKCGTTDVWDKITSHPSVIRTSKEPHFWARYRVVNNVSVHTYLKRQSSKLIKEFKLDDSKRKELITCDGSTSAFSDNRWQNMTFDPYDGPEYLTVHIMKEIQPNSKHIIMLREPLERVYSDFRFFGVPRGKFGNKKTPETFHNYTTDDINTFKNCTKSKSHRACAYLLGQYGTRTLFSYYAIYVRDWLKVFPRDQLYILRTEDWKANCTLHLQEIYRFLELEDLGQDELTKICNQTKKFVNNSHQPMLNTTKAFLEDFFREKNQELSDLLNDKRFLWH